LRKNTQNKTGAFLLDFVIFRPLNQPTGMTIMTSLREKMKQEMTLRGLATGTQEHYLRSIVKLHDHYKQSPAKLSEEEIKSFLLFVMSNETWAASTYNVMIHGIKFFYEVVLNKRMVAINLPRVKESQKLPDILSQNEVTRIIKATSNLKHRTILILIYGAGLRASEAASLRVKDIDSDRSVIHIREGKGKKDRYVILSPFMLSSLRVYWKKCRLQTSKDKEFNKGRENDLIFLGQSGDALSASSIGAIYKRSKKLTGINKQGGVHSLRHAFATHALEAGADLYTIKQLLGHASITSTARYLHMTDKTLQSIQSPVDQLDL
jgi:site-specific recombinase XerD